MSYELVDTPAGLSSLLSVTSGAARVAIDTEAASFHRYHDRIYLIQISDDTQTWVVDPLAVGDLAALGELLADNRIEKIFHDADYDLRLFHRQHGFLARNLFDTRIAAQLLGEPGIGLAAMLQKYIGVSPDKRFQRADWSARPLTAPMLDYAAMDTAHLCKLRDILHEKLVEMGRWSWAEEEFANLENLRSTPLSDDPRVGFLRMKGARRLTPRALAILRELYAWRDITSARLDRAQFRVLGNEVLFYLAENPARTRAELEAVRGIGREVLENRGGELLAAIKAGLEWPEADLPAFERGPRRMIDPSFEERVERLKARRNQIAERYQLPPGVLCPNGTLEAIARAMPANEAELDDIPELRNWQRREFGAELMAVLPEPAKD